MKNITVFIFTLFISSVCISQNWIDSLDLKLGKIAEREHLPGFAVALVNADEIVYTKGFGFADVENEIPYTSETIQNIGSITKTTIGVSLMQLVEAEKLDLDTPINDILPFEIHNPYFPDSKITVRHLATHTSTITDTDHYEKVYLFKDKVNFKKGDVSKDFYQLFKKYYNKNQPYEMVDFMKKIVLPGGEWYKKKNFLKNRPGEVSEYSNLGSVVAAHIVEVISGETFDEYTRKHIFQPLSLKNTGWNFDELDMTKHTKQYITGKEIPGYSLISYPDGGMITSASQLAIYLREFIRGTENDSRSVLLTKASFEEMMTKPSKVNDFSYGVFLKDQGNGFYGHTGGDPGTTNYMFFSPVNGMGMILIANTLVETREAKRAFGQAWGTLFDYGKPMFEKKVSEEISK